MPELQLSTQNPEKILDRLDSIYEYLDNFPNSIISEALRNEAEALETELLFYS